MNIVQTIQHKVSKLDVQGYSVPKGNLTITEWQVATQTSKKSSLKVALYWDAKGNGNDKQWKLIDVFYTAKGTLRKVFHTPPVFTSNGKSKIFVRQWVAGQSGPRETFVRWKGQLN
jgi:hypothetical protein